MNQHYTKDFEEDVYISNSLIESYPSSSATFDYGSIKSTVKEIFLERPEVLNSLKEFSERRARVTENEIVRELSKSYKDDNLVFVLGAGVSKWQEIPLWKELINELMKIVIKEKYQVTGKQATVLSELFLEQFSKNPLIIAKCIRKNVGRKKYPFERYLKNILYKTVDTNISPLFDEIVKFCNSVSGHRLESIITYNYDDLIEYFCEKNNHPIRYNCVYSNDSMIQSTNIPIYHVHGFLPEKSNMKNLAEDSTIVLSEETYHEQYYSVYNWSNLVQLNRFMNNSCLFLGLSFEDPNMRRLLDYAHKIFPNKCNHYVITERKNDKIISGIKERLREDDKLLNIKSISGLTFDDACNIVINFIYDLEEEDRLSFGVKTYRLDNRSNLPKLLKRIREK